MSGRILGTAPISWKVFVARDFGAVGLATNELKSYPRQRGSLILSEIENTPRITAVSVIQAYVFMLLTMIYLGMAVAQEH